jgi:hypothetical protein
MRFSQGMALLESRMGNVQESIAAFQNVMGLVIGGMSGVQIALCKCYICMPMHMGHA